MKIICGAIALCAVALVVIRTIESSTDSEQKVIVKTKWVECGSGEEELDLEWVLRKHPSDNLESTPTDKKDTNPPPTPAH